MQGRDCGLIFCSLGTAGQTMKRILVIFHSATGGTTALVSAFRDGATASTTVETVVRTAGVASTSDVLSADALVFATPECFGSMAGELKAFFERTFYACMNDTTRFGGGVDSRLAGRPYATIVCAGGDGSGAAQSVDRIAAGWRLRRASPGIVARRVGGEAGYSRGQLAESDLQAAHDLGHMFAEALAIGAL